MLQAAPATLTAIAELALAAVAVGAIVSNIGKSSQSHRDVLRRVEDLEDAKDKHHEAWAAMDKGLALLNQTITNLDETLASFPCRNQGQNGACPPWRRRREDRLEE